LQNSVLGPLELVCGITTSRHMESRIPKLPHVTDVITGTAQSLTDVQMHKYLRFCSHGVTGEIAPDRRGILIR
jgi:hypothetical protein